MKYFRMSYNEVVFERSYVNLLMLNRAIPGIKPFDKDKSNDRVTSHGKEIHTTPKRQHANDFFENLM